MWEKILEVIDIREWSTELLVAFTLGLLTLLGKSIGSFIANKRRKLEKHIQYESYYAVTRVLPLTDLTKKILSRGEIPLDITYDKEPIENEIYVAGIKLTNIGSNNLTPEIFQNDPLVFTFKGKLRAGFRILGVYPDPNPTQNTKFCVNIKEKGVEIVPTAEFGTWKKDQSYKIEIYYTGDEYFSPKLLNGKNFRIKSTIIPGYWIRYVLSIGFSLLLCYISLFLLDLIVHGIQPMFSSPITLESSLLLNQILTMVVILLVVVLVLFLKGILPRPNGRQRITLKEQISANLKH